MLDKLKIFNKEKSDRSSKAQISKRTSSSSGFSSARSERSDSSLSLNNDQMPNGKASGTSVQGAPSILKKPEPITTKSKSKLLSSSSKTSSKDTLTKKSEKKEKSPARMSSDVCDNSKSAVPKVQKPSTKAESKLKPVANRKSFIENRSESKTSLSQIPAPATKPQATTPQTPQTNIPAVSTGIPKPMAAIKGTTKLTNPQKMANEHNDKLNDISNGKTSISDNGKMQIIAPILIETAVNHHHQQMQMQLQMQMQQAFNQQNISMSDSCHSKSTYSSSIGPISNSNDSNYMQASPASNASDAHGSQSSYSIQSPPNKLILMQRAKMLHEQNINNINGGCGGMMKIPSNGSIASTASSSMTATSSSTANKFNTVPTKQLPMVNGIIYEEDKQMTVLPMRPLLRGYNSHLTLPTRGNRNQHIAHEYNDDLAQGYCSDGDALRKMPVRYSDIENGYMSEGGSVSVTSNANGLHQKPMLLRARTQLPTTIEER